MDAESSEDVRGEGIQVHFPGARSQCARQQDGPATGLDAYECGIDEPAGVTGDAGLGVERGRFGGWDRKGGRTGEERLQRRLDRWAGAQDELGSDRRAR